MATEEAASRPMSAPLSASLLAQGPVQGSLQVAAKGLAQPSAASDPTLDQTLAALADPCRRAIVEALREGEQRPSDLAERLAISRPALSRHLRILRQAGLVSQQSSDPDARVRPIRLRPERLGAVRNWLETVESCWVEQLDAFRRHVEGAAGERRR